MVVVHLNVYRATAFAGGALDFLDEATHGDNFVPVVERLLQAARHGDDEVPCSGADYLHVLEVAIALTLSAGRDHERVHLPHEDRSLRIFPHPYRMDGGDEDDVIERGADEGDQLFGGDGYDLLGGGEGDDLCDGGRGKDSTNGICAILRQVP